MLKGEQRTSPQSVVPSVALLPDVSLEIPLRNTRAFALGERIITAISQSVAKIIALFAAKVSS
jgi:hypothetical protein